MEEAKVFEACFSLADDLMWESEQARIERLPEQMAELSEMTNEFVRIAKQCYYQIEDIPDSEAILLGAIRYLNAQAIPPLRGNYSWFSNSLSALLELVTLIALSERTVYHFYLRCSAVSINV